LAKLSVVNITVTACKNLSIVKLTSFVKGLSMSKFFARAKNYYWASIVMSLGVVYNLAQQDLIGVGICLILSAGLIGIGLIKSRR